MKRVAIVQSCYIPWKGYFDLINSVHEFILYDEVQFTKRDWRNRNRIKNKNQLKWLTIPVKVKGRYQQRIKDTLIADPNWAARHWKTIRHAYARAGHFSDYEPFFEELYLNTDQVHLSEINSRFISAICDLLGIRTRITFSLDYRLTKKGRTERLVELSQQAGAAVYLSGPRARNYLDESRFHRAGIEVIYMDYSDYPEYQQLHPPFVHQVSVIDLIFNEGCHATKYMKSFN